MITSHKFVSSNSFYFSGSEFYFKLNGWNYFTQNFTFELGIKTKEKYRNSICKFILKYNTFFSNVINQIENFHKVLKYLKYLQ